MILRSFFNRAPLPPNHLSPLPLGAIQPEGWLGELLGRQADQLEADLAGRFPGAQGNSAWLGGDLDDAQSAPEALASLAPIAYATGRQALTDVVSRFVAWSVEHQGEDGDFGPAGLTDWWPKMLMLRVMRQYFLATGDREPLKLMDRFFRFQLEALGTRPLMGKAASRAAENMLSALWLYNLTGQNYLLKLCRLLDAQSLDWTDEMHIFPHIRDTLKQRPLSELMEGMAREGELNGQDQKVNGREFYLTNALDVAFGLKAGGIINLFKSGFKELTAFSTGWPRYMKRHGVALGMFTGDTHLAGVDPSRGVNLAALAETMGSLSTLLGTGEEVGALEGDLLEKLALNAPVACWDEALKARPAQVQVNQISRAEGAHGSYDAPFDALCEEARPLDLADQALALYAASLWYATADEGLAAISYAPCAVHFVAGAARVRVTVEGDYPVPGTVRIRVKTRERAEFPIYLRIPGWAEQAMIKLPDGELMQMPGGETACVRREWTGEAVIEMELSCQPRMTRWAHQSAAVELGPLLMACDLGEEDLPEGWNWALNEFEPMKAVRGEKAFPDKDACCVLVKAVRARDWEAKGLDCAQPPIAPRGEGREEVLRLVPFGSTKLRIAQFPLMQL